MIFTHKMLHFHRKNGIILLIGRNIEPNKSKQTGASSSSSSSSHKKTSDRKHQKQTLPSFTSTDLDTDTVQVPTVLFFFCCRCDERDSMLFRGPNSPQKHVLFLQIKAPLLGPRVILYSHTHRHTQSG